MEKPCLLRLNSTLTKRLVKEPPYKGGSFTKKFVTKQSASCFTFKAKFSLYFAERIIY